MFIFIQKRKQGREMQKQQSQGRRTEDLDFFLFLAELGSEGCLTSSETGSRLNDIGRCLFHEIDAIEVRQVQVEASEASVPDKPSKVISPIKRDLIEVGRIELEDCCQILEDVARSRVRPNT